MKPCYCINPNCRQPDHPDNNNPNSRYCYSCGSELSLQGQYRVSRLLSDDSGFGIVYEVFKGFEAKILKVLQPRWNKEPKAVELFKREYEVLLTLTRENVKGIPQAEDFFEYYPRDENPVYCLVMEKVEGMDLEKWVQQNDRITQRQALKWLKEVTLILNKIHDHNWFHRDIKPANIMLRNSGELVLIDFGTAREETQTYYQKMQGQQLTGIVSTGYTPNEQQNGQSVIQSDFFALGRTFVYLLTGQHPSSMYDPYKDKLTWRQETENVDKSLLDFIDNLMAKFPQDRPSSTDTILSSLETINRKLKSPSGGVSAVKRFLTFNQSLATKKISAQSVEATRKVSGDTVNGFFHKKAHRQILWASVFSSLAVVGFLFFHDFYGFGTANSESPEEEELALVNNQMDEDLTEADLLYNQGNEYRDNQEYSKAIEKYTQALELDPSYADAYYNRALTHVDLKQYQEAIADYSRAIEVDPEYIDAYNNRGIVHAELQDYDQAIADYSKAIELDINYVLAYNNRGVIYGNLGQYQEAIADYSKAIELNPNYALAYNNRGISYQNLERYEDAIADYSRATEINPDYAEPYYNRGNIHRVLERYENAIADYSRAIDINSSYANAYYNRALTYSNLQQYDNAIDDYTQAAALYRAQGKETDYQDAVEAIKNIRLNLS